jgi:hypothetical protein
MNIPKISDAVGYIDDELVVSAQNPKQVKHIPLFKWSALVACFVLAVIIITAIIPSVSEDSRHLGRYKRISLKGGELAGDGDANQSLNEETDVVVNVSKSDFPSKMKVYEIVPAEISKEFFGSIALSLGITNPVRTDVNKFDYYVGAEGNDFLADDASLRYRDGELSYVSKKERESPITDTDEELIEKAKRVFEGLNLDGEYECLGIASVQILTVRNESFPCSKRVAFRRIVDGHRVIGDDYCDIYMCSEGVYDINAKLFNYVENGEIDVLDMETVISRVKTPDSFSFEKSDVFEGLVSKITINKSKMLLVNQYDNECEILQPVYNLMGVAENESGSTEFSSKIIAIPDKYIKYEELPDKISENDVETISAFVDGYDKITLNDKETERFIELFNKSHFTGRPDGEHGTADGTVEVILKNGSSISVSVFECGCNPEVRLYNSDGGLEDYYTISNIDINPFVKSMFDN